MNYSNIVGRQKEIKLLNEAYDRNRSEFIAIYGRRRVGKTFLVKQLFGSRYSFQITGLSNATKAQQLTNFFFMLTRADQTFLDQSPPEDWFSAFQLLIAFLEKQQVSRKVIFIDELPWLDTPKSDFISALENFWNGWAYHRNDILLITCGSATSWMINKLIKSHGGLYNRVTERIFLQPFTLKETADFFKFKGGVYTHYELIQLYMAMGGVPFYLDAVDCSQSIFQNIDRLFFQPNSLLGLEYMYLFQSLFHSYERHTELVEALAEKAIGLSRNDLVEKTNMTNGGRLTKVLEELEQCGFIKRYLPFGKKKRDSLYQLTDFYSLFYLKFVKEGKIEGEGAWLTQLDNPKWRAWSGYAFEGICRYHIQEIKAALGITAVYTEVSSWRSTSIGKGAQIDLIIDRRDQTINICEMKFSVGPYTITKAYEQNLRNKLAAFKQETNTRKSVFLTMISTFGLNKNQYAASLVQNDLTMDVFFE